MEKMSFIGTFDQLFDLVPTAILAILNDRADSEEHIYRITVSNNFLMIW
jgi:hypothetical protein